MKGCAVVEVASLVFCRYGDSSERPRNWDKRKAGEDRIKLIDGSELSIYSEGGQSPPLAGWKIVIAKSSKEGLPSWTLYGLPS